VKRCVALVSLLAASAFVAGCAGSAPESDPPIAAQREVAERFAEAIFHGQSSTAVALLARRDDDVLSARATRAAASWQPQHGTVRLPGRRAGNSWTFGYAGTHSPRDGRFEQVRGRLVVVVATAHGGAAVRFFAFLDETTRFSTHHDSLLLPSNR